MTTEQPSLISDEDLRRELSTARGEVDRLLAAVRDFSVVHHAAPWLHLDDTLADLRAASITVATLERLQAVSM